MVKLKRLSVTWSKNRKSEKFITAPKGAHNRKLCMPLAVIIRDVLNLAETGKEAKNIIKTGAVLVDNKICKDQKRGVGILDTLSFCDKAYRIIMKKIPTLIEIPKEESKIKICKILGKSVLKNGKTQLNLHDGRNIILDKNLYSTNDSLLIELPEQKILNHVKFEEGSAALILSPAHAGEVAKIKAIKKGLNKKLELEDMETKKVFEAPFNGVIVIGKDKPLLTLKI